MPSNHFENLRGGIHTLDELSSPNNNCSDDNNGILLENPTINHPLRLTLRLDNIPPCLEPNTGTEEGIVRPSSQRELRLSPLRENNQIIGVGESSVYPEMLGSPSNPDPLGLQVSLGSIRLSPRVSPDLNQDTSSHAGEILPRPVSSHAGQVSPRLEASHAGSPPPRSVSLGAVSGTDSNGFNLDDRQISDIRNSTILNNSIPEFCPDLC